MKHTYYLLNNLKQLVSRHPISAHTPGHKNGTLLPDCLQQIWGNDFAKYDVTELTDLDQLHFASGCIAESQQQAAKIWNAKKTYYLVNGTTAGIQAAIMATCYQKEVFVPRHVHRSVYHSLILAQATPIYLPIAIDEQLGIPLGVSASTLEQYILRYPQCKQLLLVNPTYQGVTWQNQQCVAVAKSYGLTVIVDEAHGSHLHFSSQLPPSLLDCGADIVIQSWHKTLPVLTQASVLHLGHDYAGEDMDCLLSLLQTTSPSYLLLSSLEAASIDMGQYGTQYIEDTLVLLQEFAQWIKKTLTTMVLFQSPHWQQDPFKIYLHSTKHSGDELAQQLQQYAIYPEMSDSNGCLLLAPLKISPQWLSQLKAALVAMDQQSQSLPDRSPCATFYTSEIPLQALPLQQAFFSAKRTVPWEDATDEVCAQFVIQYPPGIPILVPGEVITSQLVALVAQCNGSMEPVVAVLDQKPKE